MSHKVHLFAAQDLEWDPLEREAHEELQVQIYPLQEARMKTLFFLVIAFRQAQSYNEIVYNYCVRYTDEACNVNVDNSWRQL